MTAQEYVSPAWPPAAERAFARWCAEQLLIEDYDAPHGQAFLAGWLEGVNVDLVRERG